MVRLLFVMLAPAALGGCLARAAVDLATAPVRVTGRAVDLATTSQSESDEERGRMLRESEERYGKLDRRREEAERDCLKGELRACDRAAALRRELDLLRREPPASSD